MKRVTCFLVVLFTLLTECGCSQFMQITIPDSATMLGLGSKTEVRLINDTPLYGTVMSMNENLGNFDPGATLVSATSFALEYSPVLVAVLFYETAARDRVVGIAIGETWVRRGEVQSKVFRIQDIRFLNGSNAVYRDMYPAPQKGTNREVDAPMMGLMSTTWVLWANASLFDVEVDIGGKEQRILPAGGLYWMQITNVSEVNRQIVTKMTCLDGGRVRRDIREERFTPGHGYPMVRTFLMDAYWFPRY